MLILSLNSSCSLFLSSERGFFILKKPMKEQSPNYYSIIPANVRYDKRLKANAKLLYGEITALCNEKGYCWANNNYFASLYDVSKVSISKWINQLIEYGYIESHITYKGQTKEIDKRYLAVTPIKQNLVTPNKLLFNTPIKQNFKDNITRKNNTSINNNRSFSEISKNIFDHWNKQDIIKHQRLVNDHKEAIKTALKTYSEEEIIFAIDNYSEAFHSDYEYCSYKKSLYEFIKQKNLMKEFMNDGSKRVNFLSWKNKQKPLRKKSNEGLSKEELIDYANR